ncbi:hypothetical protein [Rhizobium jaguaris]|uniref:Endonuclease/exonuclease/phosphatase family protein n=1 Tax=Rhizobium jaguaris TaxID=1312183 RepID=A0A387G9I3_9HYPH|nr:hypothetical protein [Rhizobium jaguaris]AYG64471.1 hypothetical protein CCGE525_37750 [Rhizobium jaguaris]
MKSIVHLKSSCVSPLDDESDPRRGHLEGDDPNCQILQRQPAALEAWIERDAPGDGRFVLLGDFNRSLWYEGQASQTVRTDGSDPTTPLPSGVKVTNLFKEVFDGNLANTSLMLLHETCPVNAASKAICDDLTIFTDSAKRKDAKKALSFKENLGCRNPIELDHILVGMGLAQNPAEKVALGNRGRTLPASEGHPDPLLAISDHCHLMTVVGL